MKTLILSSIVAALGFVCLGHALAGQPDQASLGSPDFQPSPDCPVGWRGDGNGRYPAAEPPLTWGRNSRSVQGLGAQAKKPAAGDQGKPAADGVVREWLIVGPVAIPEGKAAKEDFLDEPGLAPDEGDKLGDLVWKAVASDSPWIHFQPVYGKTVADPAKVVAYAHAWVRSAEGRSVYLNAMVSGTGKFWLNGKEIGAFSAPSVRAKLPLKQGWNSLLVRVAPQPDTAWSKGVVQWHLNAALFGTETDEYEIRNLLWSTPMPDDGPGVGSPILVGDRLFVTAEGGVLVCVSAADGKVLWARSSTYADAATSGERQNAPEVFAQADKLTAQISQSLDAYCRGPGHYKKPDAAAVLAAWGQVNKLLQKMDRAKYPGQSSGEAGESAPTPVSDGRHVYVLYGSGVAACFDLDGNRKWTAMVGVRNNEHGYAASPCLVDGKLIIKSQEHLGAVALGAGTGRVVASMPLWKTRGLSAYSAPLPLTIGGEKAVVQSFGVVTRVKDGRTVSQGFAPPYYNVADYLSPTAEGRTVCSPILSKRDGGVRLAFQTLPDELADSLVMRDTRECEFDVKTFPCWFAYNHSASPLLHQGLAYLMSVDGVLTVIDAARGEVVYQKLLDFNPLMMHNGPIVRAGCAASPTLGGQHIYLWDDQGTCVVIEPGRTFKQVARNRIDRVHIMYGAAARNECMISNPVFSGKRIYVRGENNLYCIGEEGRR